MKYLVLFGSGKNRMAVVQAPRGDYDAALKKSISIGAGKTESYESMFRQFETARKKGDKSALRKNIIEWADKSKDMKWFEDQQVFADVSEVYFRPVAPNTVLGIVNNGQPKRAPYTPRVKR